MSTAMIVYIASIVTGVQIFFGVLAGALCILSIVMFVARCDDCCKTPSLYFKIGWTSLIVAVLLSGSTALIPTEDNIYKIAGVTAQEKASIDASGKIVMQKNEGPK